MSIFEKCKEAVKEQLIQILKEEDITKDVNNWINVILPAVMNDMKKAVIEPPYSVLKGMPTEDNQKMKEWLVEHLQLPEGTIVVQFYNTPYKHSPSILIMGDNLPVEPNKEGEVYPVLIGQVHHIHLHDDVYKDIITWKKY